MRKNPHAAALGRKGGLAARGNSGRKRVETPCPRCRVLCPSVEEAKYHYRICGLPPVKRTA